ncbi:MAG TPA: hypothetical protein VGG04_01640 [Candidatus Sulfotelmatobacter sp.]|jgi:hypothetical protein
MATNLTGNNQNAGAAAKAAMEAGVRGTDYSAASKAPTEAPRRSSGYGLPCAKCHLYYPADLDTCPTCKHSDRVSPIAPKIPPRPAQAAAEPIPDGAVIEQEREEFLRQFKAQLLEAHLEAGTGPEAVCKFGENHPGDSANAEICQGCYERIQERADVCEAALHMELKEAAQIIYDAVWADPSDPSKTYQNAASSLLTELRKRAGITTVLGPFQPLTH